VRALGTFGVVASAAAVVALVGALHRTPPAGAAEPHAHGALPSRGQAADFASAREQLAARMHVAESLAQGSPESFHRLADAAGYHLDYARLTGDYASYAAAQAHVAAAFAAVERRGLGGRTSFTGPHLLKAQLDFTLHRNEEALRELSTLELDARSADDPSLSADVLALRGAALFGTGRYDEGLGALREAVRTSHAPSHAQRLSLALAKVGEDEEALRGLVDSPDDPPRTRAWLALARADVHLGRGRRVEARREIEAARVAFPGDWHADEHLAELDADEGHLASAKNAYESLVARTDDPEFMDALARLVEDPERAKSLRARAHALYMERLARLPEATYGHALEHALHEVADPSFAVALAEKNRALRPDGEALTRLAQAYFRAGRVDEAVRTIGLVQASRWTSAESLATAEVVLRASGDEPGARVAGERARALDPNAPARVVWLTANGGDR
jgi:tetratricopeptide (TPR) repeat protein